MEFSLFLAKAWGLYFLIIALAFLLNKRDVKILFESYRHSSTVLFTGLVELVIGLLTVLSHNIWAWDFRGLITLFGWLALTRGVVRVFAPDLSSKLIKSYEKSRTLNIFLVLILGVGLYLTLVGFGYV